MSYISPKAKIKGYLEGENVILGPTAIGNNSIIGVWTIIGYPKTSSIKSLYPMKHFNIKELDQISKGAKIGRSCIVRSGTVIYEAVTLGDYVETGHNVLIREGSVIGERTRIGSSTQLDGTVKVGKNVNIQSNVYIPHLTTIGDKVFIAPNVCFTNDLYPPSKRLAGVMVEENSIIGANVSIIAGVKIGRNSVVAAGSVVTKDVPANTVVKGVPARPYMTREEYDNKMQMWEELINKNQQHLA